MQRLFFFPFHFQKPLNFILDLPKWKFYANEGPNHKLLTGLFSLIPPLTVNQESNYIRNKNIVLFVYTLFMQPFAVHYLQSWRGKKLARFVWFGRKNGSPINVGGSDKASDSMTWINIALGGEGIEKAMIKAWTSTFY